MAPDGVTVVSSTVVGHGFRQHQIPDRNRTTTLLWWSSAATSGNTCTAQATPVAAQAARGSSRAKAMVLAEQYLEGDTPASRGICQVTWHLL